MVLLMGHSRTRHVLILVLCLLLLLLMLMLLYGRSCSPPHGMGRRRRGVTRRHGPRTQRQHCRTCWYVLAARNSCVLVPLLLLEGRGSR